jgi:colanic acid biosynthesis glycosyl transferase WcaI
MPQAAQLPAKSLDVVIYGLNYAPEMIGVGRYTGDIGHYLTASGHNVRIVTAPPHYPGWSVARPYSALCYTFERCNGMSIVRCPIFLRTKMRGIWRLLTPLSFAISSAPVVLWAILRHRPDVVFCVEPTLLAAPAALFAAKCAGTRTVLHVHDLEIDAAFAVGHLKTGIVQRVARFFERFALSGFDQIISISARMREHLVSKRVSPDRIALVRNWTDLDQIRPLYDRNLFRVELGFSEETFVVLYSGSIGAKQALHVLLDAAERFTGESRPVAFVVAGEGPAKPHLTERYGHLPNVRFLPLQPEDRLCELLNLADLHVLPQARGVDNFVLPSKLGGLLASGKPLLVTADPGSELYELLRGAAIFVPAGDTEAIAKAIAKEIAQIARQSDPAKRRKLAGLFSKNECLKQLTHVLLAAAGETEKLGRESAQKLSKELLH